MIRYLIVSIFASASSEMEPFIVGGSVASISDWPFIAFLSLVRSSPRRKIICGGSLISSQTVLTAAHCVVDVVRGDKDLFFKDYEMNVYMGHSQYLQSTMKRLVVDHNAHDQYKYTDGNFDICILFLEQPVQFSQNVKKAVLVSLSNFKPHEKSMAVAGWGRTMVNGGPPVYKRLLKMVGQTMLNSSDCQHLVPRAAMGGTICANEPGVPEYPFAGDSGGPLIRTSDRCLVGVVSTRLQRAGITTYSSIPYYFEWIRKAQKKLFDINCPWNEKYKY